MSRKYDRAHHMRKLLNDPAILRQLFKPKPWWMPHWLWSVMVHFVVR